MSKVKHKCPSCSFAAQCGDWESLGATQEDNLICPECGTEIDPRNGKVVPGLPEYLTTTIMERKGDAYAKFCERIHAPQQLDLFGAAND